MSNYPRPRPHSLADNDDLDARSMHESFMDLTSPISPPHYTRDFHSRREDSQKAGKARSRSRSRAPSPTSSVSTTGSITFARTAAASSTDHHQPRIHIDTSADPYPGAKPPLPTTPKPDMRRSGSADGKGKGRRSQSRTRSPKTPVGRDFVLRAPEAERPVNVPPTTNFLDPHERADLVRKTRKLAQVFGQTPSPLAICPPGQLTVAVAARQHHRRGAASISTESVAPPSAWASGLTAVSSPSTTRRFSTPLSPSDFVSLAHSAGGGDDTASFIDLSDEETDDGPSHSPEVRPAADHADQSALDSPPLDSSSMADSDAAEEDRRRKREKLAKLHRFLGSRVPANLVLGLPDPETSLPAAAPASAIEPSTSAAGPSDDTSPRPWRIRRRRSSSAAEIKSRWLDNLDRVRDELDEREKAINVRRAIKMEKVFGVQPPQTLYHTRPSPQHPTGRSPSGSPPALSPMTFTHMSPIAVDHLPPSPGASTSPTSRNINQSAYINKRAHYNAGRLSPTDSTHFLLDPNGDERFHWHSASTSDVGTVSGDRSSSVYIHFRHSLNSLSDIIDRDDKESLAELHKYLTGGQTEDPVPTNEALLQHDPDAQSLRSERRRSLPARASVLSLASQFTLASPEPEMISFQARRRRAAKLTNFFGVDYRDLVGDVLDSIESGVEEERHRGSLQPEEVQDLLQKLRRIKTKRTGIL